MKAVSFSCHIGRDGRTGKKHVLKTIKCLDAVEKHNNHDYTQEEVDRLESDIDLSRKYLNQHYVVVDEKLEEFQGYIPIKAMVLDVYEDIERKNRQAGKLSADAENYLARLSRDKRRQIAVEGLLQIGDCHDWEDLSDDDRLTMGEILLCVFWETVQKLTGPNAWFIIISCSLHYNEGTPHLHFVGIPLVYEPEAKDGYIFCVKKSVIFNEHSLGPILQDYARELAEKLIREAFDWQLIPKQPGRGFDFAKFEYVYNDLLQTYTQCHDFQNKFTNFRSNQSCYNKCYEDLDTRINRCRALSAQRAALLNEIPPLSRKKVARVLDQVIDEQEKDAECMRQAQSAISDLSELIRYNPFENLDSRIKKAEKAKEKQRLLEENKRRERERASGIIPNQITR